MKTLFIEAKYKEKVKLSKEAIGKLPEKVCLVTTVQFIDSLEEIKKQLEKENKEVILKQGKSKYPGQILGCDIKSFKDADCDAFLYIGDGMFHPKALLFKTNRAVFVFNPFSKKLIKLDENEIEKIKKKQKAAYYKFLSANEIGILVSVKSGQNNLKKAIELKNKLDKNCYIFLCDTLDFSQLENFPFIECWVNTMCPRIGLDDSLELEKPIINIEDIE